MCSSDLIANVTVTVNAVNDGPIAVDDSLTIEEDTPALISVLANDYDLDNDPLSIVIVGLPNNGSVSLGDRSQVPSASIQRSSSVVPFGTTSQVLYTPNANFNGQDSFQYTISDGKGGTATAVVIVNVLPINGPPEAIDDEESINGIPSVLVDVLNNDSDIDADSLSISLVSTPANGSVIILNSKIQYVPLTTFSGLDDFIYTISDGQGGFATATVRINVAPVPDVDADSSGGPKTGDPGDDVVHPVTIANTGNASDTLQLKPVSSQGWNLKIYHDTDGNGLLSEVDVLLTDTDGDQNLDSGELAAGTQLKILVIASIPAGTLDGEIDQTNLTVCSTSDPSKKDEVILKTTATAPSISVVKSVSPAGSLPPGTILTYTVEVTNGGSGKATNLRIIDDLSSLLKFTSGSLKTGPNPSSLLAKTDTIDGDSAYFNGDLKSVIAGGKGTTLEAGDKLVLEFRAVLQSAVAGSKVENIAAVNFSDGNGNSMAAVSGGVEITIDGAPLLHVQKLPSSNPVGSGQDLIYTIEYSNLGNTSATGVKIIDQLSPEVVFLADDPLTLSSGGTYDSAAHEVTLAIGSLGAGVSDKFSFKVKVKEGVPDGTEVFNHAYLESDQTPALETSSVIVGLAPNLVIKIQRDVEIVTDEDEIQYQVDFSNVGNQDSSNTLVTVPVPTGTVLIPSSVSGLNASFSRVANSVSKIHRSAATINGDNTEITWNVGLLLRQGGTGQEGFRVEVPNGTPQGTIIPAEAAIESDEVPRIVAQTVTSVVVTKVELNLAQTPDKTKATYGELVTFTVDVINSGDEDLTGVVVRIPVPAGTSLHALPAGGSLVEIGRAHV